MDEKHQATCLKINQFGSQSICMPVCESPFHATYPTMYILVYQDCQNVKANRPALLAANCFLSCTLPWNATCHCNSAISIAQASCSEARITMLAKILFALATKQLNHIVQLVAIHEDVFLAVLPLSPELKQHTKYTLVTSINSI